MLHSYCLSADQLVSFLDRHRKNQTEVKDYDFHTALKKIVDELKELVPSEGSYVLLDDPQQFVEAGEPKNLIYIAGYGENAAQMMGLKTVSTQGLISQAYRSGTTQAVKAQPGTTIVVDKIHLPKEVKEAVCVPLKIGATTIGVLALFNKQDGYTMKDLRIIHILSSYMSMVVLTAVDTKKNKELTKRDNLTDLYNDRYFHAQLEKEIYIAERNKSGLVLLFLDLDNFKSINDQYGHLVGSQTLKEVAFVLRGTILVPNATLARYGGDEYVCILPAITLDQAIKIANSICNNIHDKMFMVDRGDEDGSFVSFKGVISASIGISSLHDHTVRTDTRQRKNTLVRLADLAMYNAKDQGKNCVCVAKPVANE